MGSQGARDPELDEIIALFPDWTEEEHRRFRRMQPVIRTMLINLDLADYRSNGPASALWWRCEMTDMDPRALSQRIREVMAEKGTGWRSEPIPIPIVIKRSTTLSAAQARGQAAAAVSSRVRAAFRTSRWAAGYLRR